jgi:hypothetical protein
VRRRAAPARRATRNTLRARSVLRALARHPATRQLAILGCYLAAGVAVTWPRADYLVAHKLPATRDAAAFVWGFWWLAHQVEHLGNPWSTGYLAAPAGTQLGLHTLMPLEGVVMLPVTVVFGPSASYNLLSAAIPGLLCYAAYRAARLWLRTPAGAIAAGGFFGLSGMLDWRSWYHLNLATGAIFLPLALAAAVRLRRDPGTRRCVILGLTLAASLLTDAESAVMAAIAVLLVLAPWLVRRPSWRKARAAGLAAGVAVAAAAPQLAAVAWQAATGGASVSARLLAESYTRYGVPLSGLFAPSPRLASFGLTGLGAVYYRDGVIYQTVGYRHLPAGEGVPMFGVVLTTVAVLGLLLSWRRRSAWLLALAWLGAAALALGPVLWIGGHAYTPAARTLHGARVSAVLPYAWFVQLPGLSGFREAGRLAELGLLPAALLAGAAVDWLRQHTAPARAAPARATPALATPTRAMPTRATPALAMSALVVVAAAGLLEAGWSGNLPAAVMPAAYRVGVMPTALPVLDRPIAASRPGSIVVDFPFGICGGLPTYGAQFPPEAQVLATADGHPRAVGFVARVPAPTIAGISKHAFYTGLVRIWRGTTRNSPAQVAAARLDARAMNVGWVLVWPQQQLRDGKEVRFWNPGVLGYLARTGFRFAYQADAVLVYRAAS